MLVFDCALALCCGKSPTPIISECVCLKQALVQNAKLWEKRPLGPMRDVVSSAKRWPRSGDTMAKRRSGGADECQSDVETSPTDSAPPSTSADRDTHNK